MGERTEIYEREKLYEEVWKEPVLVVANRYGVSNVALAKACRKLAVPLPPRGYWARVRAGRKAPPRPPLPPYESPAGIQTTRRVPGKSLALQPARSPTRNSDTAPRLPPSRDLRRPITPPARKGRRQIRSETRGRPRQRNSRNTFIAPSTAGSERFASESTVSARSRDSRKRKAGTTNGIIYRFLQPSDITTSLVREEREPVSASSYGFTRHTFQERTGGTIQRPLAGCGQSRDDCSGVFTFRRTRSIHSFPAWLQTTSRNSYSGSFGCIIDRGILTESNSLRKRRRWKTCSSRLGSARYSSRIFRIRWTGGGKEGGRVKEGGKKRKEDNRP